MNVNGGQREDRPLIVENVVIRALCGNARTGEPISRLRGDDGLYARNPSKPDEDRPSGQRMIALASARARDQSGGRPYKMTTAQLRRAQEAMGQPETHVGALCEELSITRQTLYRHVGPKGEPRPDGEKRLAVKPRGGAA